RLLREINIMVNEQHEMIVAKEKFLIFWQLRVSDIETSERFLLYGKSARNYNLFYQNKAAEKIELCCKIHS
ncbi:MAG: hypothetical protein AAGA80_28135, partial [Cyanobacteria bacterium P01_F01_bin.143]